jgi:hypothetical protein
MSDTQPVSPPMSINGWSWRVWLSRQKSVIKTILSLFFAYLASLVPTSLDPNLQNGLSILFAFVARAVLDYADFYFSEVPVESRR